MHGDPRLRGDDATYRMTFFRGDDGTYWMTFLRGDDGVTEPTLGTVIPEMRSIVRDLLAIP